MDDAGIVRELECREQLLDQRCRTDEVEVRAAGDVVGESDAFDVLHRDERDVGVFAILVDADDVRVMEPAGGLGFVAEARHEELAVVGFGQVDANRLERHLPLDDRVERVVDGAHRALAERPADLVLAEAPDVSHGGTRGSGAGRGAPWAASDSGRIRQRGCPRAGTSRRALRS